MITSVVKVYMQLTSRIYFLAHLWTLNVILSNKSNITYTELFLLKICTIHAIRATAKTWFHGTA